MLRHTSARTRGETKWCVGFDETREEDATGATGDVSLPMRRRRRRDATRRDLFLFTMDLVTIEGKTRLTRLCGVRVTRARERVGVR